MRSMWWQLGMLGTVSAFAYRHRETKKNLKTKKNLCASCWLLLRIITYTLSCL